MRNFPLSFLNPGGLWLAMMLMVLCLLGRPSTGQELRGGENPERVFQEAADSYRQADYYRALIGFRKVLRDYPEHGRVTAALLMQAKCYYWLQNYDQASESLHTLLEKFPHSTYLDNARYILGNCYYRQGYPWRATDEFRQVILSTDVPALAELARDCLRVLIASQLSPSQLTKLFESLPDDDLSPWILLEAARRELSAGYGEEAVLTAERVLQLFPESQATAEAVDIKRAALELPPQAVIVGVICPLSGPYAHYGEELRNGAELAALEHNTRSIRKVELQVRDTRAEAVQALQATRSLIEEAHALAIVGPLLSTTAVGAGAISDCHGVPLITPTASEGSISAIGKYVFQRGVAARMLGKRAAAFAVEELGLRQLAVLAPRDDYGSSAVEGFSREAADRGAQILTVAWYPVGATDFKDQLTQIRRRHQAYTDSLVTLGQLYVDTAFVEPDSIPPEERRVWLDGLFVPAYPEEAGMIAPQIAYHRIETQILGTSAWGSPEALRIGGQYLDGAIFATDFSEALFTEEYDRFITDYRIHHGKKPGKVGVFSYECTKLVLRGVETGVRGPEGMSQFLAATEKFPGLSSLISLTRNNGANEEAMILAVQEGRIVQLK
jgi:branched-chain amino acid transport system substrate-binding protein